MNSRPGRRAGTETKTPRTGIAPIVYLARGAGVSNFFEADVFCLAARGPVLVGIRDRRFARRCGKGSWAPFSPLALDPARPAFSRTETSSGKSRPVSSSDPINSSMTAKVSTWLNRAL